MQRNMTGFLLYLTAMLALSSAASAQYIGPIGVQNAYLSQSVTIGNDIPTQWDPTGTLVIGYSSESDWVKRSNGTSPNVTYFDGDFVNILTYNNSVLYYLGSQVNPPSPSTPAVELFDSSSFSACHDYYSYGYGTPVVECNIKGGITSHNNSSVYISGGTVTNAISYAYDSSTLDLIGNKVFYVT
jgi:hypothetical protein